MPKATSSTSPGSIGSVPSSRNSKRQESDGSPVVPATNSRAGSNDDDGLSIESLRVSNVRSIDPEKLLQAVVLADSFNNRFKPLTLDRPKAFLPVVNQPLLEYTFEFLAVSGVHEIIVFCCYHSKQIKDYLRNSKWGKPESPFGIKIVESIDSMSVGDAMREIDSRSLIQKDFILLNCDIISNMRLDNALQEHIARRQKDKNTLMTMVVKKALPGHRSRTAGEESCVVIDPETSEVLQYQPTNGSNRQKYVTLDLETLNEHGVVSFRNDYLDCRIDICSPEVPALFTENFDWQDIRQDFVKGVLESDLLGHKIYAHMIYDEYAARVQSIRTYDSVSKDIMMRWSFPYVPDSNILAGQSYSYSRGHIYKENGVVLARSCLIESQVVLGEGTTVGNNTKIRNSVIGRHCKIGDSVVLDGVYVWDNTAIGDRCKIDRSIIASNVTILNDTNINQGCLISDHVVLGPSITLPPQTRVAFTQQVINSDDSDQDEQDSKQSSKTEETELKGSFDAAVFGAKGQAYIWDMAASRSADEFESENFVSDWDAIHATFGGSESSTTELSDEMADESTEEEDDGDNEEEQNSQRDFIQEARQTVLRGIIEKHPVDNTVLELNALKFALNSSFKDCYTAAVDALLDSVDESAKATLAKLGEKLKALFLPWGCGLLKKFVQPADQLDLIKTLEDKCLSDASVSKAFSFVLQLFYAEDVISDDTLILWYSDDGWKIAQPERLALRSLTKPFMEKLKQQMEEDDDDEEDED